MSNIEERWHKMGVRKALVVALVGLVGSVGAASATTLVLPGSNPMSTSTIGDFEIYSFDLLQQCSAAGDPRCAGGPYDVSATNGAIQDEIVIYQGNEGNTNAEFSGVDDPLQPPEGSGSTFNGTWEGSIATIYSYLDGHDLVFLFGNNQTGTADDQTLLIWASVVILDGTTEIACFELFGSGGAEGCGSTNPTLDLDQYVAVVGDFCVDAVTGAAYPEPCAAGDYNITNNLGQNGTEFAAFNEELNNMLALWASLGYTMQVNISMLALVDGSETLWICDKCDVTTPPPPPPPVPAPAALLLLGSGLIGMALVGWRRRSRRG